MSSALALSRARREVGMLFYRWNVSKQGDRVRQFVTYIVEELLDFLHPLLTAGQRRNKRIWEDHPLQLWVLRKAPACWRYIFDALAAWHLVSDLGYFQLVVRAVWRPSHIIVRFYMLSAWFGTYNLSVKLFQVAMRFIESNRESSTSWYSVSSLNSLLEASIALPPSSSQEIPTIAFDPLGGMTQLREYRIPSDITLSHSNICSGGFGDSASMAITSRAFRLSARLSTCSWSFTFPDVIREWEWQWPMRP